VFVDESPDFAIDSEGSAPCEMCGEEGAAIHLLRVQDGKITHARLCHACAEILARQTEGMSLVLAVPTVLQRLGGGRRRERDGKTRSATDESRLCTVCGTTLADVKQTGTMGCPVCYQVFAEHLWAAMNDDDKPVEHLGKIPRVDAGPESLRHELTRLRRMLRELVETERFEEAASVRDRLADLTGDLASGGPEDGGA
jgi:protein arginine kinase activator